MIFNLQNTPLEPSFLAPTLVRKIRVLKIWIPFPEPGRGVFISPLITKFVKEKKLGKGRIGGSSGGLDMAQAGCEREPGQCKLHGPMACTRARTIVIGGGRMFAPLSA